MIIRVDAVVKFFIDLSNKNAIKGISEVETKSEALAKKFNSAGKALTVGLTTPIVAFGTYAVKTASDFDSASSQIQSSLGLSTDSAKEFDQALRDIYNAGYGESYEDVANKISYVAQATGELDPSKVKELATNAMALEDTFGSDFNETIRGVSNLMTHFGISSEEAFDLFAKGSQVGLDYTTELGDNIAEYGGNFEQAGYSAEEYFQLLANGTKNGAYNLDKVNDSINEVKNRLGDGTIEANLSMFSKNTKTAFKNWEKGKGTMKDVINSIVNDISTCKNEQDQLTMAATAFGTMGEDANLKVVTSLTTVGDEFNNVKGAMDGVKEVKYDNLGSMLESLKRQFGDVALEAGNELMPAIENIVGGLQDLVTWFKNLDPETKTMIGNIAKVAAVVGPALIGFSKLVSTIKNFKDSIKTVKSFFNAFKDGKKVISMLKMGGVALAITAVAAAVLLVVKNWDKIKETVGNVWNSIKSFFSNIGKAISDTIASIGEWMSNLWTSITTTVSNIWNSIVSFFSTIGNAIASFFQTILSYLQWPIQFVTNMFLLIVAIIATFFETVYNLLSSWFNMIFSFLSTIAMWIYNNVLLPVYNFIVSVATTIYNAIVSFINTVISVFSTIASWIYNNVLLPVYNFFVGVFTTIYNVIVGFINNVIAGFQIIAGWIYNNVLLPIYNFFVSVFNTIWGVIQNVINNVKNAFTTAANFIKNAFTTVKNTVVSIFNAIANTVKKIFNTIVNVIKSPINGLISLFNNVIKGLNKIKVPDWVPGVGGKGINIPLIPKLATGTNYVASEGLAYLHKGEAVVPKKYNPAIGGYGNYNQPIYVTVNADMDVNKFGKAFVRDIKTFSGGTKNSYNYGGGK